MIVWNYGIKSQVLQATHQTVHVLFKAKSQDGTVSTFRKNLNTLMGWKAGE